MEAKGKVFLSGDETIDLTHYIWDDQRFSEQIVKKNPISLEQALDLSKFLKETINDLGVDTITPPVVHEILKLKLNELGVAAAETIELKKSLFIKNGLALSANAKTVLERRYLRKDNTGKVIETPVQMFRRVAHHIAQAELAYGDESDAEEYEALFYDLMTEFKFLPNSPTLMNAGRRLGQLAACFVLPVNDSMEGIFEALKNAAIIHKSGGGTGFAFSRLRPKNSMVGTTGGIASGPVSFMKIFNTATEQVKQGGTRRGANMAILRVDHPDITEFIHCKDENDVLNNFNISVGLTEVFMEAVREENTYDLVDPKSGQPAAKLNARDVYRALVSQAWENGDPGILFLDRVNRDNPTPQLGEIESTNPCGEQPLLPMEACNLGSINLSKVVTHTENGPTIDYTELGKTVSTAVRFLDDTIDMSKYPLPEIDRMVKGNRKIGLGVMGFADMLYQLQIPYNSEKALETAEEVMQFIQDASRDASVKLGRERGVFKNFDIFFGATDGHKGGIAAGLEHLNVVLNGHKTVQNTDTSFGADEIGHFRLGDGIHIRRHYRKFQ